MTERIRSYPCRKEISGYSPTYHQRRKGNWTSFSPPPYFTAGKTEAPRDEGAQQSRWLRQDPASSYSRLGRLTFPDSQLAPLNIAALL